MTLVLVETDGTGAIEVSRETLTFVRDINQPVHALVVGDLPPSLVDQLGEYGVESVKHVDGPAFATYAAACFGCQRSGVKPCSLPGCTRTL